MKDVLLYHGDYVRFVLDQPNLHTELDLYCSSSLIQQSAGTHILHWAHYPDSEQTSVCSYSLMLRTEILLKVSLRP